VQQKQNTLYFNVFFLITSSIAFN